jgi:phosphonate transport system substrate-binding protein
MAGIKLCMILILLISAAAGCKDYSTLGSRDNPLNIALTPSKEMQSLNELSALLEKELAAETGLYFKISPSSDIYSIIDGFEKKKIDGAVLNTFGYLIAHFWGDADAVLNLVFRSGHNYYSGAIVAGRDSQIKKPSDITGKTFAYVTPYSTSGFILPLKFFRENSIEPSETEFTGSYMKVVQGVYENKYDAGAVYYDEKGGQSISDARNELIAKYPDAAQKLVIIASTGTIRSGPFALHKKVPAETRKKLVTALINFSKTESGRKSMLKAYDAAGFMPAADSDYNELRQLLKNVNIDAESLIPDGKLLELRKKVRPAVDHMYP